MKKTIYQCTCTECAEEPKGETAKLHTGMNLMVAALDEKNRRRFAGLWASQIGYGGVQKIARITGISRTTIGRGQQEVERADAELRGRTRGLGGGRKQAEKKIQPY